MEIWKLQKIIKESKNILNDIQKIIENKYNSNSEDKEIKWSVYKAQINSWETYSEQLNKFRIKIWEELKKLKNINNFINENKDKINLILKTQNNLDNILKKEKELFNAEENEKFKEIKDSNFLEQFTKIKFREMQMKLVKFFKDSTNYLASKFKGFNISEKNQELTHLRKKIDEIKHEEINLSLNFQNNGVFLFAVIQDNLDFLKFLLNSGIKIEIM